MYKTLQFSTLDYVIGSSPLFLVLPHLLYVLCVLTNLVIYVGCSRYSAAILPPCLPHFLPEQRGLPPHLLGLPLYDQLISPLPPLLRRVTWRFDYPIPLLQFLTHRLMNL